MDLNYDLPSDRFVTPQAGLVSANDSVAEMFRDTLSNPVEYPGLDNFVFSGDSVAFVLLDEIHDSEICVQSMLECLLDLLDGCTVFIASPKADILDETSRQKWRQEFAAANLQLNFEFHEPEDKNASAYIAVNIDGDPLYINRVLFDCDVVVPVRRRVFGDRQPTSVFPIFSIAENRSRYKDLPIANQRSEVRLIHESLGINFVVEVETNPGGDVVHVVAGQNDALQHQDEIESVSAWDIEQLTDGKVVVATIESKDQTWEQFFDALIQSSYSTLNNEQIVIRSEIDQLPGSVERTILQLQFESDQDSIERLLKDVPERYHCIPGILEDKSVFLKSNLDENDIEELGLGWIETDSQIQKIIDHAETGVFLRDAHLCRILDVKTI